MSDFRIDHSTNGYEIVPLNSRLTPYVDLLETALSHAPIIVEDQKRRDFYSVVGEDGGFYIHVHGSRIYLVQCATKRSGAAVFQRAKPGSPLTAQPPMPLEAECALSL